MGISIGISSSIYDMGQNSDLNPDPADYIVKEILNIKNNLVVRINYPSCITYEGNKILVYKNVSKEEFDTNFIIDPHFSENGFSPFARLEPTKAGLEMAIALAQNI